MICLTCQKDLEQCTCPDLQERLAVIYQSKFIHITPETRAILDARAERNKALSEHKAGANDTHER